MPVEDPIVDLSSLNELWPLDSDLQLATDDHLRLVKDAVKKSFTDMSANGGVVTVTAAEINYLTGALSNIQAQIDNASPNWRYTAEPTEVLTNNTKLLADPVLSGMLITLPNAPPQGTEVQVLDASGLAAPPDNQFVVQRAGRLYSQVPEFRADRTAGPVRWFSGRLCHAPDPQVGRCTLGCTPTGRACRRPRGVAR